MPDAISPHISYREATFSPTAARKGIPNVPGPHELEAMRLVATECFEPARAHFGPLRITSFYRSQELNRAIGGARHSQHCFGEAIDIDHTDNLALFHWLRANVPFDQLILEYPDKEGEPSWIHVSYSDQHRRQVLVAVKVNGRTVYKPWTP